MRFVHSVFRVMYMWYPSWPPLIDSRFIGKLMCYHVTFDRVTVSLAGMCLTRTCKRSIGNLLPLNCLFIIHMYYGNVWHIHFTSLDCFGFRGQISITADNVSRAQFLNSYPLRLWKYNGNSDCVCHIRSHVLDKMYLGNISHSTLQTLFLYCPSLPYLPLPSLSFYPSPPNPLSLSLSLYLSLSLMVCLLSVFFKVIYSRTNAKMLLCVLLIRSRLFTFYSPLQI